MNKEQLVSNLGNDFLTKLAFDKEAFAKEAESYLKIRVREDSIFSRIIEPETATREMLERDPYHETLHMVKEIEPDSFAITGAPRGFGITHPIQPRMITIPKMTFQTPLFKYTKKQLEAYDTNVIQILEENVVKDVADQVDKIWFAMVERALTWLAANADAHGTSENLPFTKRKLLNGSELLVDPLGRTYPGAKFVMNAITFNHLLSLDNSQLGDDLTSRVFTGEMIDFPSVMGMKYIITTKTDIVPTNVIYFFAPVTNPGNTLGWHYNYKDLQFTVESYHDQEFEFQASMDKLMCLGNGYGVAKLNLVAP